MILRRLPQEKRVLLQALDDLYKNIVTIKPDIIHACNFMPMFFVVDYKAATM